VSGCPQPPLPEADVIALLALGRTREESAALQGSGASGFGGQASNLLINEALNTAVSSRVQRLFGVSRIKIDPQGLTSETNVVRGPQVTIEQQVASNLTITYSTNVSVASQQIIQVEYNITRNISIVGLRDQNGVVSFDVKIRQRKRGTSGSQFSEQVPIRIGSTDTVRGERAGQWLGLGLGPVD